MYGKNPTLTHGLPVTLNQLPKIKRLSQVKPSINDISKFLATQGPFDWAVTMNLKKRHPIYQTHITPQIFEQTGWHYLSLTNKALFKRQYRYGHVKLNCVFCMEIGGLEKRPHLHFAIGNPSNIDKHDVYLKLRNASKKLDWIKGDIDIRPYQNKGWLNYLLKTGFERVLLG